MIISDDDNKKNNSPDGGNKIQKLPPKSKNLEAVSNEYDETYEKTIRPKSFDEYIGQSSLKETLKISIEASKRRNVPLDHLLFYGPPGLGKTTLSGIIETRWASI